MKHYINKKSFLALVILRKLAQQMNYKTHPNQTLQMTGDKIGSLLIIIQRWEEPDNGHRLKTGVIWLNQ